MKETPDQFDSPEAVLDYAVQREREAQRMYAAYAARTERSGFRQLLLSMLEMEKSHEARLLAIRKRTDLGAAFSRSEGHDLGLDEMLVDVEYSPEMEYGDFLILVIKKEGRAEKLYRSLAAMAREPGLRDTFRLLAGEEGKHKFWAQDRYDQDILKEN